MPEECSRFPRALVIAEIRRAMELARAEIRAGRADGASIETRAAQQLAELEQPSLRRVINATGVVLHTNLGRAPLREFEARDGLFEPGIRLGSRPPRKTRCPRFGTAGAACGRARIAVNNNAAAVFLALNELAAGGEAIVSRGELIEIGDGFRIPEIMARSGAVLREVGTTNRTQIADYRDGH